MRSAWREEPCKSALNRVKGMGFAWSLNPYMGCEHRCTFCYVRGFELRADRPADDRYGRSIRVKVNLPEVLERELRRKSWRREQVVIGAATDPYQPAEGTYRLTRRCIQILGAARTPLSIITRGPLVVRDIDVLREAAARCDVQVNISIPTLDERIWRTTEPATARPRQRLRAVTMLVEAGIKANVAIAPILPGLTDDLAGLSQAIAAARAAGATGLWANVLNLRTGTREHFLENLARDWPDLLPQYEALYQKPYLDRSITGPLLTTVTRLREKHGIADRKPGPVAPPTEPEQLALFAAG